MDTMHAVETEQQREERLAQALNALPRVALAQRPTPLEHLPRLSAALGGPQIYIKRDDLTGLAFGGNKTRMLEFSLADAQAKGAEVIVFGAAVQSNYCRQLAAACAKLGLELHLLLRPEREIDRVEIQGNHLLQRLFGAKVTVLPDNDRARQQAAIRAEFERLQAAGRNVYWPRGEDTVDLDALAYAEVALEIVRQCREQEIAPRLLYTAAFDTTQAGLVLGMTYLRAAIHVRGISPSTGAPERFENMARIANQGAQRLDLDIELTAADFDNDNSYAGERYGVPTDAGIEATHLLAQTEGILIDPVYTSKALSALIDQARRGQLDPDDPVVFLHTGGAPALFAFADDLRLR
jgi:1-aminocyclopropane-1-carboxylate deaminase/D-cysteine desulfhydrase-like pyridoxal-dependent ACC family enzyme